MNYMQWLSSKTSTAWWTDTADLNDIKKALAIGAVGVTTNPVLAAQSLSASPEKWRGLVKSEMKPAEKAEALMQGIVKEIADLILPEYKKSEGKQGYVCGQVNPEKQSDTKHMVEMAARYNKWAPNIAVKLPGTLAGMRAVEECVANGITVASTANFTVPQALAVGESCRKGGERAKKAGKTPGKCFVAVMIGRLDDYLRDVAADNGILVSEADITKAGLAVIKRAYSIFNERKYEAILIPAAMRGSYHVTEIAGSKMILSVPPKIEKAVLDSNAPQIEKISEPVDKAAIERLVKLHEFVRAYEPDGIKPEDFINYGLAQRTLTQFVYGGWGKLEAFK